MYYMIAILIVCILLILFMFPSTIETKKFCWQKGERHTWIYKDMGDGNEYMVCKECGQLPGGDREENH